MANGKDLDFGNIIKEIYDQDNNGLKVNVISSLIPSSYDTIELSYTGDDVTQVIYKNGGLTVATLDLTYFSGKLIQIDRS